MTKDKNNSHTTVLSNGKGGPSTPEFSQMDRFGRMCFPTAIPLHNQEENQNHQAYTLLRGKITSTSKKGFINIY